RRRAARLRCQHLALRRRLSYERLSDSQEPRLRELTGCVAAGSAARLESLAFVSLMADNAVDFCRTLADYLARRIGRQMRVLNDLPWQECEQKLYDGQADLGVVCGLQYVCSVDRGDVPGIELLAASVMRGPRYLNRPVYFSEVVVRQDHPARSLAALRGATWAYNEPTSHSGYAITRYA